jgi:hypothetical protein
VYLPDGAVPGRVVKFTPTGLVAIVEKEVPREGRYRFTLHLQGNVIGGEIASIGQDDNLCRLQFAALTDGDRARLEPFVEADA